MKASVFKDLLVAIDIGTTKICVLIAQPLGDDMLEVVGIGKSPSHGLAKGVVVDIGKTVHSIKNAVREAELMAGTKVESAVIGISGAHIDSRTSQGMIPIKRREIRTHDVEQVIQSARAVDVAEGQQILHVLPQFFIIDSKEKVLDPTGMYGVRLEAQVHIITGSVASVHNLIKCCSSAGIKVTDIVLEQLASAEAVLTDDERQLGVAMLDIGGGTSDLAIYHNSSIRHTMVLPVAGNHFTHDLAIGLQTTLKDAERVKKEFGSVLKEHMDMQECVELLELDGLHKKVVLRSELIHILNARSEELFHFIRKEIEQYHMRPFIPAGLVLTGGGSLLEGMKDVAHDILKLPIRLGNPQLDEAVSTSLKSPIYATGYGLLLHALKKRDTATINNFSGPMMKQIMGRMKSWVADFF